MPSLQSDTYDVPKRIATPKLDRSRDRSRMDITGLVNPRAPAIADPVLVLGATSLIGRFLVPRLATLGVEAIALSRKPTRPPDGSLRWLQVDLDGPQLGTALPDAATVISLSPIWALPPALPALKARGMQRLVAFSSTSVFTKAGSDDEGERRVAQKLAGGEAATMAFCEAHGVAWTILRFLPLAGSGQGLRQPVHADDLAMGALLAAVRPAAHDRAYDLPGGETLTYRQMAERVFEGMGRRPRIVTAPEWLWALGFAIAKPLLKGATAQMGKRMAENLVFKAGPAQEDLSWAPRDFQPKFAKRN